MMSTGNMKKSTDALKLKKGLYRSIEDREEETQKPSSKPKTVEEEKEKLMARFNL